jgi:hypothetical protein
MSVENISEIQVSQVQLLEKGFQPHHLSEGAKGE